MVKISETQEDRDYFFVLNFDEIISDQQLDCLFLFWDENKKYFDERLFESQYVLFKVTNLVNPSSIHFIRRIIHNLKDELSKLNVDIEESEFKFEYNKKNDRYDLKNYPVVCPTGYIENGNICSIESTENSIQQFRVCPVGTKWHEKLNVCLPEKTIKNIPEGYFWDFDSACALPLKSFKKAKMRDIIKNEEIEEFRKNIFWKVDILDKLITVDANVPTPIKESLLYNFYQYHWRNYKSKIYIEIGKSVRENFFSSIEVVYEEDGVIYIKIKDKPAHRDELVSEIRGQVSYYWDKMVSDIENDSNLPEIMYEKEEKVYLKLEDGSAIGVNPSSIDLIK